MCKKWGEQGNKGIFGEQENKNKNFDKQRNKAFFSGEQGNRYPSTPWDLWPLDHAVDCKMSPAWVGKLNMCIMHFLNFKWKYL